MTGSLQIKRNKFYVVLSYKDGESGKFKTKWVSTGLEEKNNKRKAEAMIPMFSDKYSYLEQAPINDESNIEKNFISFMGYWLNSKKGKIEPNTWECYSDCVKGHLIPYFEKLSLQLSDITAKHILDYYEYKFHNGRRDNKKGGLSVASIRKHGMIIKEILKEAVIMDIIPRNVATNVPIPKRSESQDNNFVFLNTVEANNLLSVFKGHHLQALVYTTLYYGLRRSEVLGLKWDAIDFENNTLKIQHTVVRYTTTIAKDRTKSQTSRRTFSLIPEVKELLLLLQKEQKYYQSLLGDAYVKNDYIFKWKDGHTYRPDYVTNTFKKVLENNGLKHMRFHDLRHSTASILYDKGWDIKDIQEWLGHADIETTSNIYTHISQSRKQALAKNLEHNFTLG